MEAPAVHQPHRKHLLHFSLTSDFDSDPLWKTSALHLSARSSMLQYGDYVWSQESLDAVVTEVGLGL